jgi:plastocyanin
MHIASAGRRTVNLFALMLSAEILGCGGSGSSSGGGGITSPPPPNNPPPNASTVALSVMNNHYSPANDSVATGATLTWTWDSCTGDGYGGSTCTSHSVMFDDGVSSSGIQDSGTFARTFMTAGTYTYHCAVHGAAMSGKIIVK